MKMFLLIGFATAGMLTSFAQAQTIPLTIDPTQSAVSISIDGAEGDSPLSGDLTLSLVQQSQSAQITGLNLAIDEAVRTSLFFGSASTFISPGEASILMTTPGAAGTLTGTTFSQLNNSLSLDGDLVISDSLGFAGGNQTLGLSAIEFDPVDFNSVTVTRLGSQITVSNSSTMTGTLSLVTGDIPVTVELNYVATGIVTPELTLLGDVDRDGSVDCSDIGPFIRILSSLRFQDEADCNGSGAVDFLDIGPFIVLLMAAR